MKEFTRAIFYIFVFLDLINCECTLSKNSLSDSDREKILNKHNELRNKLAEGKEGNLPQAKNIEEMVWDQELSDLSQKYANTCPTGHNSNRKTNTYSDTGENLYWSMNSAEKEIDYSDAVQNWYDEVKDFNDKGKIAKFQSGDGKTTGNFTQVIWHDSSKLGCGVNTYKDGTWFKTVIVCNYYKVGNIVGYPIYDEGSSGSGCSQKSSKYSFLCESGSGTTSEKGKVNETKTSLEENDDQNGGTYNPREEGEGDTGIKIKPLKKGRDWRDPRWDSFSLGGATSDEMMRIQGKLLQQIKNKMSVAKAKFLETDTKTQASSIANNEKEKILDEVLDVKIIEP